MIIVEASSLCSPLGTSGSPAMSGIPNTVVWVEVRMVGLDYTHFGTFSQT